MKCTQYKNGDAIRITLPDGRTVRVEFGQNRRVAIEAPEDVKVVHLPRGVERDGRGVITSIG